MHARGKKGLQALERSIHLTLLQQSSQLHPQLPGGSLIHERR